MNHGRGDNTNPLAQFAKVYNCRYNISHVSISVHCRIFFYLLGHVRRFCFVFVPSLRDAFKTVHRPFLFTSFFLLLFCHTSGHCFQLYIGLYTCTSLYTTLPNKNKGRQRNMVNPNKMGSHAPPHRLDHGAKRHKKDEDQADAEVIDEEPSVEAQHPKSTKTPRQ